MFLMSARVYDFLKKMVTIILPAVSSAYFSLASIYEWGNADKVVGTIAVITTFLGVCLGISSSTYNKLDKAFDGNAVITNEDGFKRVSLELNEATPLDDLESLPALRFKIVSERPNRPLVAGD